ncbi:hypothetical protein BD410DRAFT_844733 [Rickenella mellea]|uniref:Uncharacterized protein n=1 Tax=Rickenella mellea TaxID=50990 RepID=A0A4Y7PME2_9AGAM|nr:hypothetical protein BD410DRAFT_844733 [Rickenella mellea]
MNNILNNDGLPGPTEMSLSTHNILEMIMKKHFNHSSQGNVQYTLAAGALSASISSQLIGITTSTPSVVGGIVRAALLLGCITGVLTIAAHAIPFIDYVVELPGVAKSWLDSPTDNYEPSDSAGRSSPCAPFVGKHGEPLSTPARYLQENNCLE